MAATRNTLAYAILGVVLTIVLGDRQYMTIYEDPGSAGTFLSIEEKMSSFEPELKAFLRNASSYCAAGWWVGYSNPDFNIEGGVGVFLDNVDGSPRCDDRVFMNFNSMRYLGSADTNESSIAFYSKASYHGLEQLVMAGDGPTNTTFTPMSAVTMGYSNWTLYEGPGLSGNSFCLESTKKVTIFPDVNSTWPMVGSFVAGCESTNVSSVVNRPVDSLTVLKY